MVEESGVSFVFVFFFFSPISNRLNAQSTKPRITLKNRENRSRGTRFYKFIYLF